MSSKKILKKISASALVRGSTALLAGNLVANVGNYAFNLLVGRFLGPADYGVMASIIALLYIVSVPSTTLSFVVTKFTTRFKVQKEFDQLSYFFVYLNRVLLFLCFFVLLFFVVLSGPLSRFLKVDSPIPVIFLGALLGGSLLAALNNSILQGLLKFRFLSVSGIGGTIVKLVLGVSLVFLGFSVGGALTGFLASFLVPYLLAFWPLKFLFKSKREVARIEWGGILRYAAPVFVSTLGLTLLYTGDVVLVKHFFQGSEAGLYSALSLIARIILFVTTPIGLVMFPLISEKHIKGERYSSLFLTSLLLVFLITAGATVFYSLFPEFIVKLFFGSQYLSAARYLGRFAIFLSLYSLCNLFASFYLSISRVRIAFLPLFFGVLQMGLMWFYHNSFLQILNVATGVVFALLLCFVLCLRKFMKT